MVEREVIAKVADVNALSITGGCEKMMGSRMCVNIDSEGVRDAII